MTRELKILYLHQHFNTREGAGGSRSYEFAKELVRRGHHVTILCGAFENSGVKVEGEARKQIDGINIIALALPYSNKHGFYQRLNTFVSFALRSSWIALTRHFDLILASSTPLTVAIPALVAKRIRRTRYVFEVRDLWPDLPVVLGVLQNRLAIAGARWLERSAYRSATACVALAPGVRDTIRRKFPGVEVGFIPNCADLELFVPPSDVARRAGHKITAIFAGTHGLANGLDAVIDTAQVLQKRERFDIKLLLIGDGKEKEKLLRRVRLSGLNNCEFHPPVKKAELASMFYDAHVGLMVLKNVPEFYFGTSPNKFFDYLSAGLPILVNFPGWISDLVSEANCGLSVSPDDPKAFASALEYIADHPAERIQMGRRARRLAEHKFDRRILAGEFATLLERAANQ